MLLCFPFFVYLWSNGKNEEILLLSSSLSFDRTIYKIFNSGPYEGFLFMSGPRTNSQKKVFKFYYNGFVSDWNFWLMYKFKNIDEYSSSWYGILLKYIFLLFSKYSYLPEDPKSNHPPKSFTCTMEVLD